jgi:hypothetical protein
MSEEKQDVKPTEGSETIQLRVKDGVSSFAVEQCVNNDIRSQVSGLSERSNVAAVLVDRLCGSFSQGIEKEDLVLLTACLSNFALFL